MKSCYLGAVKTYFESKRTQERKKGHNCASISNTARKQRRVHVSYRVFLEHCIGPFSFSLIHPNYISQSGVNMFEK